MDPNPDEEPTLRDDASTNLTISCDDCAMQHSDHCQDCIVTFLCPVDDVAALVIEPGEARALRLLSSAGLAPELRHVPREGPRGAEGQLLRSG